MLVHAGHYWLICLLLTHRFALLTALISTSSSSEKIMDWRRFPQRVTCLACGMMRVQKRSQRLLD